MPARMEQLDRHWTDFHEILCLSTFRKSVEIIHVSSRYGSVHGDICTFMVMKKRLKRQSDPVRDPVWPRGWVEV